MIAPERKAMSNIDSMLKSRDIILPKKVRLLKAMVFPVVMYGCEKSMYGWLLKNWCFWTVVFGVREDALKSLGL